MFSPKKFKHRQYRYRPWFYNSAQEKLDNKVKKAELAKSGDAEAVKERISYGLQAGGGYRNRVSVSGQVFKSNMLLLAVLAVLLVLAAAFIRFYLPEVLNMFEQ